MQHDWMNDTFRAAGRYMLDLIAGGLGAAPPQNKPENVTWEQVYAIAAHNSVEGVCRFGVLQLPSPPPAEILQKWEAAWNRTCYRQLSFDAEREQIAAVLRANGISYLPLKGILLAEYYPEPGMRAIVDNDILYGFVEKEENGGYRLAGADTAAREKSRSDAQQLLTELMTSLGYETRTLKGIHDSYIKAPFFNFEMHRDLVTPLSPFYEYYKNPWARAVQDEEDPYLYRYTPEEFYIHQVVHAFKHYDSQGCGIRFFLDWYVFLKKEDDLCWDTVGATLAALGLSDFEERMRRIVFALFDGTGTLSSEEEEEVFWLLGCGTHGSVRTRTDRMYQKVNEKNGNSKLRYVWSRLFLPDDVGRYAFPAFYRHRFLKYFLPFYRVGAALIRRPGVVRDELRQLRKKGEKKP